MYLKIDGKYCKIDNGIADIIFELNKKGYRTIACCEGHIVNKVIGAYVLFDSHYKFDVCPKGYNFRKGKLGTVVESGVLTDDLELKKRIKHEQINSLRIWVKNLPNIKEMI